MRRYLAFALCASLFTTTAFAQMGRHGGGPRPQVQNRTTGQTINRNNTNINNNYNNNVRNNTNINNNTNVNRNINVNQNVNVNRNVNVNGGCYNCGGYYHDNNWNGGSFAAGVAVGAVTTAAVAAATRPVNQTVVVSTPAVGSVINVLPGGCTIISTGGGTIYHCNSVYYRPFYQGTTLVYSVVTYP